MGGGLYLGSTFLGIQGSPLCSSYRAKETSDPLASGWSAEQRTSQGHLSTAYARLKAILAAQNVTSCFTEKLKITFLMPSKALKQISEVMCFELPSSASAQQRLWWSQQTFLGVGKKSFLCLWRVGSRHSPHCSGD